MYPIIINGISNNFKFVLLLKTPKGDFNVKATSDLATVDRTSPLLAFVENIINTKSTLNKKDIRNGY